jgi:hypothetical protein
VVVELAVATGEVRHGNHQLRFDGMEEPGFDLDLLDLPVSKTIRE